MDLGLQTESGFGDFITIAALFLVYLFTLGMDVFMRLWMKRSFCRLVGDGLYRATHCFSAICCVLALPPIYWFVYWCFRNLNLKLYSSMESGNKNWIHVWDDMFNKLSELGTSMFGSCHQTLLQSQNPPLTCRWSISVICVSDDALIYVHHKKFDELKYSRHY